MNLRWLPWTALVLATGAVAFLLFRPATPPGRAEDVLTRPPEPPPVRPAPLESTALATGPKREPSKAQPTAGPRGSVDWRTVRKAPLELIVVDANDVPLPTDAVRVDVGPAPGEREWPTTPALIADPATNSWRGSEIPAGTIEVRVTGDHLLPRAVTVKLSAEGTEPVKVKVEKAGAIAYSVKLTDGTVPEHVTLTLLDARERPVTAGFQSRSETYMSTARVATKATQGPEGVVFGVPAGRYTLRATSPANETMDASVDVVVGETVTVAIAIRG